MPVIGQPLRFYQKWAFRVEVEGVVIGGFNKAGPLKQMFGVIEQHEGGVMPPVDVSVSKYKTEKLTLERGGSDNIELWTWWKNQKNGIVDKRTVSVAAQDSQGNVTSRWNYPLMVMAEFDAGEFDGKNETENIIEKVVLVPIDMDRTSG